MKYMNFNDFYISFHKEILPFKPKYIRRGQALMNYLHDVYTELYNEIVFKQKHLDCFYDDKIIPKTLNYLQKNW